MYYDISVTRTPKQAPVLIALGNKEVVFSRRWALSRFSVSKARYLDTGSLSRVTWNWVRQDCTPEFTSCNISLLDRRQFEPILWHRQHRESEEIMQPRMYQMYNTFQQRGDFCSDYSNLLHWGFFSETILYKFPVYCLLSMCAWIPAVLIQGMYVEFQGSLALPYMCAHVI